MPSELESRSKPNRVRPMEIYLSFKGARGVE